MPFVTINGKSIFYTITPQTGDLSKPITTLFIHGLGSSSSFYHTIIPEISTFSTCIAFDAPGSGLSSLGNASQTVESITDDAVALLDSLSGTAVNEKVWVVGHSMGGMIACELAIRYPRAVKGLILLGPIDPSPALSEVFTKRIATVETNGLEALADSIPKAATGSKASHSERAFIRSLILGTSSAGYLSLCQVIASVKKPDYAKIQVPVMIIAGGEDKTASYDGCVKIHDGSGVSAEKKCIQVLPAVGHWHAIEAPEAVVREIIDFFDKIDGMERD